MSTPFDPAAAGAGDGTVVGEQLATGAVPSCGGVCTHFSCFHTCNATCLTCFRTCGPLTPCQETCRQTCNSSCFTCAGRTCPPHIRNPSAFEMCERGAAGATRVPIPGARGARGRQSAGPGLVVAISPR